MDERNALVASSAGGFPFVLVFGCAWLAAGVLAFLLPLRPAALIYIFQGAPALPLAFLLQRILGLPSLPKGHPMIPLMIQLSLVPTLGLPAVLVTFSLVPAYVPTVFAALVGAHFLPYVWLQRTRIYAVLAAVVSLGPFVLSVIMRERAFPWVGIFVGFTLIVGAFLVRSHASRLTGQGQ